MEKGNDCISMRFLFSQMNQNRNGDKFSRRTFFFEITEVFCKTFSPPHNSQRNHGNQQHNEYNTY